MKTGLAKILVQNEFCSKCAEKIKIELTNIDDISNVYLYPIESLVTFNFVKANELSMALNTLTALGYPPKGDRIEAKNFIPPFCGCVDGFQNRTLVSKNHSGLYLSNNDERPYLDKAS